MSEPQSFISIWSDKFISSAANPTATDIIAASLSAFSGVVAPLAKTGLTGEAAEEAARTADVLVGGSGNVPGIGAGAAQDGLPGLMREVAGAALGTLAGWGGAELGVAVAVGVLLLPEEGLAVAAIGIAAAVAAAYAAGKAVTSGVDAFNEWRQQAESTGEQVSQDIGNGQTITINPDQSYAIAGPNAVTYYDSQGNVTSVTSQGAGPTTTIKVDNQTGQLEVHSDGQNLSAQIGVNADGSLNVSEGHGGPATTVSLDGNGGILISDGQGGTISIPSAASGQLPSATVTDSAGNVEVTTVSADGSSISTIIRDPEGNILQTVTTNQSSDGSVSSIISDAQGHVETTIDKVPGELGGSITDTTNYDTSTGAITGSSVRDDDGNGNVTVRNYDQNGVLTSDSWRSSDGRSGSDSYNSDGSSTRSVTDSAGSTRVTSDDGHGDTSTSTYDGNGNLTSYDWQTEGGASGSNTYGPNGQITSETWNDGNGNSGINTYGANGTLESSSWQTADGHSGTNNYDENGTLISDSWQSPDGTTGTDTYNSDGSRASDTWQSTNGSDGSDTYNSDGSVASSTVTTVTTNADGSVTTTTRWDNYSTNGGDYGGGYGGDYGGSYGDLYSEISTTINPDGSSVEVVNTNQYGYGDSTKTVTSADGSYSTTETTGMGITWERSYNAVTGEYDNSTIYNDGSRVETQQRADGTTTTTNYDSDGSMERREVTDGMTTTTTYGDGTVTVDQRLGDNNHLIETTNPDGSHSETRTSNEGRDSITDNYDASGRLTSEDGYNASISTPYTTSGTISSQWETTYNDDGSSSTHEWEVAGNGQITHDTETDSYGHTVSTAMTIEVDGVSDRTTQNADGSHATAHWDNNGNYESHQYDADGHDIHDVSRRSDGSYSDETYDPATRSTTEEAYNGTTGEHSTYESSYDADGVYHEITTFDRADGSSETLQTDTINGISLTRDTSSDGTTGYYMNGSGITADQFDQYWQDYFAGDGASNDPGAGDPGTGDPGAGDGSSSAPDVAVGATDQQAAA
jgi:hypothetical protein